MFDYLRRRPGFFFLFEKVRISNAEPVYAPECVGHVNAVYLLALPQLVAGMDIPHKQFYFRLSSVLSVTGEEDVAAFVCSGVKKSSLTVGSLKNSKSFKGKDTIEGS